MYDVLICLSGQTSRPQNSLWKWAISHMYGWIHCRSKKNDCSKWAINLCFSGKGVKWSGPSQSRSKINSKPNLIYKAMSGCLSSIYKPPSHWRFILPLVAGQYPYYCWFITTLINSWIVYHQYWSWMSHSPHWLCQVNIPIVCPVMLWSVRIPSPFYTKKKHPLENHGLLGRWPFFLGPFRGCLMGGLLVARLINQGSLPACPSPPQYPADPVAMEDGPWWAPKFSLWNWKNMENDSGSCWIKNKLASGDIEF